MHSLTAVNSFLRTSQLLDGPLAGGLQESFDIKTKQYDFLYCETTGYLITYFVNRYEKTKDIDDLQRAKAAASFILSRIDQGRIPFSYKLSDQTADSRAFTFDNAICLGGLLDLYRIEPNKDYLAGAQSMAKWILGMIGENDVFRAYEELATGKKDHPGTTFADDASCIHIKEAISLFKMSAIDPKVCSPKRPSEILDKNNDFQGTDGGFKINRHQSQVFSHAHCYATEGYLYGYLVTGQETYKDIAERAGYYLAGSQAKDGGIFQYGRVGARASDATAQAIRIWRTLNLLNQNETFKPAIDKALIYLKTMLYGKENPAILYTRGSLGLRSPLAFTWVNMFAESALRLVESDEPSANEIY